MKHRFKEMMMQKEKKQVPELRFAGFAGEWKEKSLNEVALIVTGNTPNTSNKEYYGGLKLFVSPGDIQNNRYVSKTNTTLTELGFSKGRKVSKGSVLFVSIGSTIGKVGQAQEEVITNQQINSLTAINNNSNDFIYSLLDKKGKRIKNLASIQAVPIVNKTDFSALKYFFPAAKEQQKIATFLTSIDTRIQQLEKKKTLLEQYKKGVMQKIFSQEIRFKPALSGVEVDDDGKEFGKWEKKRLGEIASRIRTKNKIDNQNVLTISAQLGLVNQLDYFNRSVAAKNLTEYYLLQKNDFAYNKSYSNGYPMGAIKRLDKYEQGVVSTLYICFRFNEKVDLGYMEQYFDNGLQNKEIEKVAQEGARNHGLLNIGIHDFFDIDIKVPCLKEQTKIAHFLSALDTKISVTSQQIEQTKEYKKGLLQKMFV